MATTDVFEDESIYCVEEKGIAIALIANGDQYSALANRCTHQGGPLCGGELFDDIALLSRVGCSIGLNC